MKKLSLFLTLSLLTVIGTSTIVKAEPNLNDDSVTIENNEAPAVDSLEEEEAAAQTEVMDEEATAETPVEKETAAETPAE